MKAVLLAVGVLGLGAVFAMFEPAPASAKPVTSDDVRLVSERMSEQASSQVMARQRNMWKSFRNRFVLGSRPAENR